MKQTQCLWDEADREHQLKQKQTPSWWLDL